MMAALWLILEDMHETCPGLCGQRNLPKAQALHTLRGGVFRYGVNISVGHLKTNTRIDSSVSWFKRARLIMIHPDRS